MPKRLTLLAILFALCFTATAGRLFFLQVFKYTYYEAAAEGQQSVEKPVESRRGAIYARSLSGGEENYIPLAIDRRWWSTWVVPQKVLPEEASSLARRIAHVLGIDEGVVYERLQKGNDPYEPLNGRVDEEMLGAFNAIGHEALGATPSQGRYYPAGVVASHVLGFVGKDETKVGGQYGVEEYFNGELSGEEGHVQGFKNLFGQLISALSNVSRPE